MSTSTMDVGRRLVELCKTGDNAKAVEELYAPSIVSIEPCSPGGPMTPQRIEGIDAVRMHGKWWTDNHKVHGAVVRGPFPHGERFIVFFDYDVEATGGPMAGQRFQMAEGALYAVKDGKITQVEFFYAM